MKFTKIISTVLACVMAFGFLSVFPHTVEAANVVTAQSAGKVDVEGEPIIDYFLSSEKLLEDGTVNPAYGSFQTRQEKLESMMEVKTVGDITIYYEAYTGEVAFVNNKTEEMLFTNPHDLNGSFNSASQKTKEQLMSQIILTYLDNGKLETFYSFVEAAERQQITMKEIKDGIRVEYQIGEPAIQRLTPRMISVERFNELIVEPIRAFIEEIEKDPTYDPDDFNYRFEFDKLLSYYSLKNPNKKGLSERAVKEMIKAFPICKQFPIYVCETNISAVELKNLERLVKACCPKYTYEELDFDNQQTGFKNTDQSPPRFTMALEYRICEDGTIDVTLPANGISFDETMYQLQDITILPYMGTGSNQYTGYTFLPDGTGTIFRYEDLVETTYLVSGQMYGADYAYHEIEGQNVQTFRYPVFGTATNYSNPIDKTTTEDKIYSDSGMLAIITEGDSLATITTDHGGPLHPYNSVYATFTPRPSDEYNLGGESGDGATWTVTSARRYTKSYTIKYIMLTDKGEDTYSPTYLGMAAAYRDYLTDIGAIEKITTVDKDLPLYIESFGSIGGTDRVLSFPVNIDIPLTTFGDIQTMTEELAKEEITNVNYKLTGFANGGLESTAPYKLKWMDVLGGDDGLKSLLEYAGENVDIYPEFDFAYVDKQDSFDGVSLKKHAVKTIDGRYTRKQIYDSGYQAFQPVGGAAISASVFDYFWNEFSDNYSKYNIGAISLSTMGSDLNSDFDEDEPHHREDTKGFTADLLANVSKDNDVMISGGNAYAIPYADVITDVSLTSSEYLNASATVPFAGIVLHASKDFTGTPINMEGDIDEAILNAIENGASLFFTLSYQNTQELKANEFWSQYYSIAYDIWKTDVVKYYDIANEALGDLQNQYIVNHSFVDPGKATRIPDADEKAQDELEEAEVNAYNEELKATLDKRYELACKRAERLGEEAPDYFDYEADYEIGKKEFSTTEKYKTQTGTVVSVEYENGVKFILNYNSFDVSVVDGDNTYTVEAMKFVKID